MKHIRARYNMNRGLSDDDEYLFDKRRSIRQNDRTKGIRNIERGRKLYGAVGSMKKRTTLRNLMFSTRSTLVRPIGCYVKTERFKSHGFHASSRWVMRLDLLRRNCWTEHIYLRCDYIFAFASLGLPMRSIKLVLFDALHTIITPRLPIHVQYAQALQPYVGQLEPLRIKSGFKKGIFTHDHLQSFIFSSTWYELSGNYKKIDLRMWVAWILGGQKSLGELL
jgi:hypothetical protein